MSNFAIFHYQPTDIKVSATGQFVRGFEFPSDPTKVLTPKIKVGKLELKNASVIDAENMFNSLFISHSLLFQLILKTL